MRLSSDFWCSALLRQVRNLGAYAYLTRRGSNEAGTIFILLRQNNGFVDLYGPAPQSYYTFYIDKDERYFTKILNQEEENVAIEKLEKELKFDADLWLIEIENLQSDILPFKVFEE